ncbi:hypothetical protein [Terriglobus roseus]|uniref:hypothetical protein n=1 Tax=Terriglobus roseus TaxID=392734 RepID=UPI0012F6FDA5|nr:hypothetical protein [Terriglobus roseus]
MALTVPRFGTGLPAQLYSLAIESGKTVTTVDIPSKGNPLLFTTANDRVIVGHYDLQQFTNDLKKTAVAFSEPGHGRTVTISPDGTTLVREIAPGNEFIDTETLLNIGERLPIFVPVSAGANFLITDNVHWISDYPKDRSFVTLLDAEGRQHLLYHGDCAGRPSVLNNDRILFTGCGNVTVLDTSGKRIFEKQMSCKTGEFAGVSRSGSRFAIACERTRGFDPSYVSSETFDIYDALTGAVMATIKSEAVPEQRSWTAFSSDGKQFVCGTPSSLSLYEIQ